MASTEPERIRVSAISSACSPKSGCEIKQLVEIDAEIAGILRIEGVLGVDERDQPARLLGVGDDVQGEGGLSRRFGTVDFDHPTARYAADSECRVEGQRSGRESH